MERTILEDGAHCLRERRTRPLEHAEQRNAVERAAVQQFEWHVVEGTRLGTGGAACCFRECDAPHGEARDTHLASELAEVPPILRSLRPGTRKGKHECVELGHRSDAFCVGEERRVNWCV